MIVYLAAHFSRREEMRQVADRLTGVGHRISSRWLHTAGPSPVTSATLADDPASLAHRAQDDIEDLHACDAVVSYTSPGVGRGGRHVEFGIGVALGKHLFVVGPREHVFHALPQVIHLPGTDDLVHHLATVN